MFTAARDGAVSVRLTDGRTFWAFADTVSTAAFVSGTAAYGDASAPWTVREPVRRSGAPFRFVSPARARAGASVPRCPRGLSMFTWPYSVVSVPRRGADRVIAFVEFTCGRRDRPVTSFRHLATGVAMLTHRKGHKPTRATIVNGRVFTARHAPGEAAYYHRGWVWTWWCSGTECSVARVRPDRVADPRAYRYWDGGRWDARRHAAADIGLPACCQRPSIVRDDERDAWVAVNLGPPDTAPGTAWWSTAPSPTGPWTTPVGFVLSGCSATSDPQRLCRAVHVVEDGTDAQQLRVSWFDPTVPTGGTFAGLPIVGRTRLGDVPW
jgi:hypothetical protein